MTRAELIDGVLSALMVTGENRPANPNETAVVNKSIDTVIDELQKREIIYIGDADDISPAVFEALVVILADTVRGSFGVAPVQTDPNAVPIAENKLREIGYGRYSGAVQQGEYM